MSPRFVLGGAWVVAAAGLALLAGCETDPYCVTCTDDDGGPGDASVVDAMVDAMRPDAVVPDAGPILDADLPDGCLTIEICNGLDDDCDGEVDEDFDTSVDVENCGGCDNFCGPPHSFPVCTDGECGIESCDVGFYDLDGDISNGCEYRCSGTDTEDSLCDLRDNDCDGEVDEDVDFDNDEANCGICGRVCGFARTTATCESGVCELGDCDDGFHDIDGRKINGCEYACTPADPPDETCNLRDDDCDGTIDEGDPGGGESCGMSEGACMEGTTSCVGGTIQCSGAVEPTTELCNGIDDDCDGTIDQGNPEGGGLCGTDVGTCSPGVFECSSGTLSCVGAVGPEAETCDGLDNNCDGSVDEGNPDGGADCGTDTGACTFGTVTCSGGALMCTGGTGPTLETCNEVDDDCNGMVDEGFDLDTDERNCGACGNVCDLDSATATCLAGSCEIASCDPDTHDLDGDPSNGCEYSCTILGSEICNGNDDDCDGMTDEGLTPPANFCNPNGVCAGTPATCGGSSGWVCEYPATYEESETSCDDLDNDCDGSVDEAFPLKGTSCTNGEIGACLTTGTFVCDLTTGDAVECNAPASSGATTETCNGIDDDCDGVIDNDMTTSVIPTVPVPRAGGGTVHMMAYEASRPDATSTSQGSISTHACADDNVVPWTTVTWPQARNACCALNDSGTCAGDGSGWRLCDAADWQTACEAGSGCTWGYETSCGTSQRMTCNGKEYDCDPSTSGDDDCLLTTGSPEFPACFADWGASGAIWDMSGNAREWTNTSRGTSIYELRGGSYTNIEAGRTCQFDFTVAEDTFAHPTTGFRCCFY